MPTDIARKELLKPVRTRKYLNKNFDGFRADLLDYARQYYPDKIKDLSENGLGGLFLDFSSYVGDVMSFYLDHQFTELDPTTAVETENIQRQLINAGVKIVGASPAVVYATFFIEIPAVRIGGVDIPRPDSLPVIREGTTLLAENGVQFNLIERLDFSKVGADGSTLVATKTVGRTNSVGVPQSFVLSLDGLCISGFYEQETISIGDQFVPFRKVVLSNPNVTDIVSVTDDLGNRYYEVNDLSDDVVFIGIPNNDNDSDMVQNNMEVIPVPYRFKRNVDLGSRLTTLIFGGGTADSLDDDILPDPSEFALPLYGKTTFPISALNPNSLLNTRTLGIAASNTTLNITYRHGGGLSHSVGERAIRDITTLIMEFPGNPPQNIANIIRSSTEVLNGAKASGGEDPPTIDDLKSYIPAARNSQERIVTKPDLLARVYTMPSNFGRVFRAAVRSNPNNPLASQLFIMSRDQNSKLVLSPDALKDNLRTYLNQYRMISDSIDILDASIINLRLDFEVTVDPGANKQIVLQNIIKSLKKYFNIKNFQIDQPVISSDVVSLIFSTPGVVSINNQKNGMLKFTNLSGEISGRVYSDVTFDVDMHSSKGMLFPPPGGIFEFKYLDNDIVGTVL